MSRRTMLIAIGFLCILAVLIIGDIIISNTSTYKKNNKGEKLIEIYNERDDLKNRNLSILIEIDSKLLLMKS